MESQKISRSTKLRRNRKALGMKRLDCFLDPITVEKLRQLIELSGYLPNEKQALEGVITHAINFLFSHRNDRHNKRNKTITKTSKLTQQKNIAKYLIRHLAADGSSPNVIMRILNKHEFPVPDNSAEIWNIKIIKRLN